MAMRVFKLNASEWEMPLDFYESLLAVLEAPHWHGCNINALVDSMVYGGINGIDPPYKIWIFGTANLDKDTKEEMLHAVRAVNEQKGDRDQDIEFQIDP